MITVYSVSDVPEIPAVYAFYSRRGHKGAVYVGSAGNLKARISDHLIRRNSSIVTGELAASIDPDRLGRVQWWEHPSFTAPVHLKAAELVFFKLLNPVLRSTAKAPREAELLLTTTFLGEIEDLARETSGEFQIPSLTEAMAKIQNLEQRVLKLEMVLLDMNLTTRSSD